MGSTQGNSLPQDGGDNTSSAQIDLLQSRFAALSHILATGPGSHSSQHQSISVTPTGYGGQKQSRGNLDHHTPPYEDQDIVRKRQKGSQDLPKFPLGLSSLSNVLNPLALPFENTINTPIGSILNVSDTEASILRPIRKATRGCRAGRKVWVKKKHSAAMQFLGHADGSNGSQESEEDEKSEPTYLTHKHNHTEAVLEIGVNEKIQNMKTKDMDGDRSFDFEPEAQASGGAQYQGNQIKIESLVEDLGTPQIVEAFSKELSHVPVVEEATSKTKITSLVVKIDTLGFKEIPEVVLTRYPRMAKYLNTLTAPQDSKEQAFSAPSTVRDKVVIWPGILPQKPKEEGKEEKGRGAKATEDKNSVSVASVDENIRPGGGGEAPIFASLFEPQKGKRQVVCVQGNTVGSRIFPTVNLDKLTEITSSEDKLEQTACLPVHIQVTKPVQAISLRPRLPERYAIPITAQGNEPVAQRVTAKPGHVPRAGKTKQLTEIDDLMEQLALIDERFSRDSEGVLLPLDNPDNEGPDFCLSRSSSRLTEASITFSTSLTFPDFTKTLTTPDNRSAHQKNAPTQNPKQVEEASPEDLDRRRRSRGPSPSPHTSYKTDVSTGNFAKIFAEEKSGNSARTREDGQETTEWASTAKNLLGQFTSSTKPSTFQRNQPSVLARIHQVTSPTGDTINMDAAGVSQDRDNDSDGVAPGEWIQPVGLPKRQIVKPKIGITAPLAPLLFQPEPAPVIRSVEGSVTGSVTGSVQPGQWTKVVADPSKYLSSGPLPPGFGYSIGQSSSDIILSRKSLGKVNSDRENAEAEAKERVIMEWRERGFREVGRIDEAGPPGLDRQHVKRSLQKQPRAGVLGSGGSGSETSGEQIWKAPQQGGLFASPPRDCLGKPVVQGYMAINPDSGLLQDQNRMVLGRSSSPIPVQPPIHQQQEQLVDPNVQDIANILRGMQTTQGVAPRVGGSQLKVNDSFAETWQDFLTLEVQKTPHASKPLQTTMVSQTPIGRQTSVVAQTLVGSQPPMAAQAPMVHLAPVVLSAPVPPVAPKVSRRVADIEQPVLSAYVRKPCPLFFAGRCTPGQACPDLHPNYDAQSGTFVDKRFATKEVFEKETLTRAEKEKERGKALDALIKQSRDEADRKCYDPSASTARQKTMNLRVAAGIVVGRNAKGEKDWIINPPPKPLKPADGATEAGSPNNVRGRRYYR